MDLKQIIVWIGSLIGVDQLIKVFVDCCDIELNIIGDMVRIKPTQNMEQTAIFNLFKIDCPDYVVIMVKMLAVVAILVVFLAIKKKNRNRILAFILLMSAAIATLKDSLFWGYTLDYIYFHGFTCYDLKDFYVDAALGFLLIEQVKWMANGRRSHGFQSEKG